MTDYVRVLREVRARVSRDQDLGLWHLARNGVRYVRELATAPLYLWGVERGDGVRTNGRPSVVCAGRLVIGSRSVIRSNIVPVELGVGPGGSLVLGEEVMVNYGVSIGAMGSVTIGDRVRLGPYVTIFDTEFHSAHDRQRRPEPRPVVIEDDVWIGTKATVLPGVRIGRGAIVGVNSVVAADVPPFTVVAGIPARPTKKLDASQFIAAKAAGAH